MYRNREFLSLARGRQCFLQIPGVCSGVETVVPAHSNQAAHGKGTGIKAHDCYTVPACHACHAAIDAGPRPAEENRHYFNRAMHRWWLYLWEHGLIKIA